MVCITSSILLQSNTPVDCYPFTTCASIPYHSEASSCLRSKLLCPVAAGSSESRGPPALPLAVYFTAAVKKCLDWWLRLKRFEVDSLRPSAFEPLLTKQQIPVRHLFP